MAREKKDLLGHRLAGAAREVGVFMDKKQSFFSTRPALMSGLIAAVFLFAAVDGPDKR